jgi:uncharacterized protein with PIN domain
VHVRINVPLALTVPSSHDRDVAPILVRVDEELRVFLPTRHRRGHISIPADGVSSLVHIVQSIGIPRTEVGSYVVDGCARKPGFRPEGGESLTVRSIARPQPASTIPPRFVADVHLGALARRLRLLGVDVTYRNDASDHDLVAESAEAQRIVLTKDRGLLGRRALTAGAFVRGQHAGVQLADVVDRFDISASPFSRCLRCNEQLESVDKREIADRIPDGTRRSYHDFSRCSGCRQIYWRGAHARSLDAAVAAVLRR